MGSAAFVQMLNPITDRYVKVDTRTGRMVAQKRSAGPYVGIPINRPVDLTQPKEIQNG